MSGPTSAAQVSSADRETVQAYLCADLPEGLRWQASAFVRTQWPEVDRGAGREPYAAELEPVHVVLADGDLLLGYAGVVRFSIAHGGQEWVVDGLGRVFVFPGARGGGRGRRLVDAATAVVREGGADLGALLCEPGLRPFYAGSGWAAVDPGVVIDRGDGGAPFRVPGPTMLLPVSARARAAWTTFEQSPLTVPLAW